MQDKKWDWKDAPEWATHVGVCQYYSSEYVLWYDEDNYLYHQDWDLGQLKWGLGVFTKDMLIYTETRPEPKENLWNGEGVPPNGTICVARADGSTLHKVKVICQPVGTEQQEEVVAVVGLEGERKCLLWWTNDYQKIKTKEEVEAEKEEKCQVDLIYRHLVQQTELSDTPLEALLTTAKNLYEDGLRFIDKTN